MYIHVYLYNVYTPQVTTGCVASVYLHLRIYCTNMYIHVISKSFVQRIYTTGDYRLCGICLPPFTYILYNVSILTLSVVIYKCDIVGMCHDMRSQMLLYWRNDIHLSGSMIFHCQRIQSACTTRRKTSL